MIVNGVPLVYKIGSIIAHEFFGHLFDSLFNGYNTEVSAMYSENIYNYLFGYIQRKSYGYFDRGFSPKAPYAPIYK